MSYYSPPLARLIEQFERLPGIGKKTAQRLAFFVLNLPPGEAESFSRSILEAREKIRYCTVCQNLTDTEKCSVCRDDTRERSIICVVEDAQGVLAFERTREYKGLYHVLGGVLSPLDGIGPSELKIKELLARLGTDEVQEVIMATNPTVEGEATASYIARLLTPFELKVTRLAYGIPVGGDLEYADEITLSRALEGRSLI